MKFQIAISCLIGAALAQKSNDTCGTPGSLCNPFMDTCCLKNCTAGGICGHAKVEATCMTPGSLCNPFMDECCLKNCTAGGICGHAEEEKPCKEAWTSCDNECCEGHFCYGNKACIPNDNLFSKLMATFNQ